MSKDYVVVTAISQFRMRYVMHKDDLQKLNTEAEVNPIEWAEDTVSCDEVDDFSQEHLGQHIVDSRMIDEDEMLEIFDRDNEYLKGWSRDYKIKWVRKLIELGKDE